MNFPGFSLEAQPGWSLDTIILSGPPQHQTVSSDSLIGIDPQEFQPNLVATSERVSPIVSLESYVESQIQGYASSGIFRQQDGPSEKVILSGGLHGIVWEQVVKGQDGSYVRQIQLVTIKESVAYTLILSGLDCATFKQNREQNLGILLSFK